MGDVNSSKREPLMFRFRFDSKKKIEAAAVVLRGRGHMDWLRFLKILYIADRKSLQKIGKPIIGGRAVAMNNGPLHSEIYDLLKGVHSDEKEWSDYIGSEGKTVYLKNEPGRMSLSPFEIDTLNSVADWAEPFGTYELAEFTHGFEEWIQLYQNKGLKNTSVPIPVTTILEALEFSPQEIDELLANAKNHRELVQEFSE